MHELQLLSIPMFNYLAAVEVRPFYRLIQVRTKSLPPHGINTQPLLSLFEGEVLNASSQPCCLFLDSM